MELNVFEGLEQFFTLTVSKEEVDLIGGVFIVGAAVDCVTLSVGAVERSDAKQR